MHRSKVSGAASRVSPRAGRSPAALAALAALPFATLPLPAAAQESLPQTPEVVVSASRVALPSAAVGSAVTVITAEDLADKQSRFVADVLREVPGVSVTRSGGFGSMTQVRLRGAESNHTLVLIDGMEVGDPFNGSEFDFSQLLTGDIARIEILRGAQSALYGSEAIGGVISITTKRAGRGFSATAEAEGGSFWTKSARASAGAGFDDFDLRVGAEVFESGGIDIAPQGNEDDFNRTLSANLRSSYRPTDAVEFRVTGRLVDREFERDGQDFVTTGQAIDSDDYTESRDINLRGEAQLDLFGGAWEQILGGAYTSSDNDRFSGGAFSSGSAGSKQKLDYQSNVTLETPEAFDSVHGFTLFGEVEHESFDSIQPFFPAADRVEETTNYAVVGEYRLQAFERLFLSGSVRHDRFDAFEDATTYRATGAFDLPETGSRLHASYGTGIKAPTFFDLFGFDPGSFVGNPGLKPERSQGWDIGLEQSFLDGRVVADVTYFQADLEDEITTGFAGGATTPVNLDGTSERSGIETSLRVTPLDGLTLAASYTYLDAREPNGDFEIRRPQHTASFNANWRFLRDRANLNLGIDYNGETEDLEFASATPRTRVTLDDFTLVSLAGRYEVEEGIELFGRVENALDQDYEQVFGFSTPGRAVYLGARLRFGPDGLE